MIKDYEDGSYLVLKENGQIYGLFHDPFLIEKIFNNKEEFVDDILSNKFNIQKYYNNKMN